jgi:hypothetical protein
VLAAHRETFRACAVAFVPALADADDAAWHEVEATVEHALSLRPPRMQRQLGLLLHALSFLAGIRFGTSIGSVPRDDLEQFLRRFQRSRILLLRRGIWGLRTLAFMGHYTRPVVMQHIGYRADPRGWSARTARASHDAGDAQ